MVVIFTFEVSPSRLLYLPSRFHPRGYHYLPMRFRPQGCSKIRAKIWSEEYIDFGTLIANPELENKYSVSVGNAESGSMPSLFHKLFNNPHVEITLDIHFDFCAIR